MYPLPLDELSTLPRHDLELRVLKTSKKRRILTDMSREEILMMAMKDMNFAKIS